jgi:hypothetical protein
LLKTFAIAAQEHGSCAAVNVPSSQSLAGFQVSTTGRIWVSAKADEDRLFDTELVELLHRLALLLPKPYLNLTRYSGIFAPNANRRNEVCPRRSPRRAHRHSPSVEDEQPQLQIPLPSGPPPPSRIPWAELLRRTFSVDVLKCPRCLTGTLAVLALMTVSHCTSCRKD